MLRSLKYFSTELWRIRLYYFVFVGSGGLLLPFLTLFYRRQGLSGAQIGVLGALGALTSMIAAPLWARFSHHTGRPRQILQGALSCAVMTALFFGQQQVFGWLALALVLHNLVNSGTAPMSDTLAVRISEKDGSAGYGSVRLFGSLGWAVLVIMAGWLIQSTGIHSAFFAYAGGIGLSALLLFGIQGGGTAEAGLPQAGPRYTSGFGLLRNFAILGMAITMVILITARSGTNSFEPVYLDQLGARESVIGFSSTLGATFELPGMLLADRLIRRFGPARVFSAGMLLWAAGNLLVVLFPGVAVILAARVIGGFAFSFYNVGLVMFIRQNTAGSETATGMALIMVTLPGLVGMLAAPLSGLAFDAFGAYWLYAIGLGGCLLAWITFQLLVLRPERARRILSRADKSGLPDIKILRVAKNARSG